MAGKVRFIFEDKESLAGMVTLVFERAATEREVAENSILSTENIEVYCDRDLIIETPTHEEGRGERGETLCAELSFVLRDTFVEGLVDVGPYVLGYMSSSDSIFNTSANYGLFALITEWDIDLRLSEGDRTYPPDGVRLEYYLNEKIRMSAVVDEQSASYGGVPLSYIEEHTDGFVTILGFEKDLTIVCIDELYTLLNDLDVSNGFMGDDDYREKVEPPIILDLDDLLISEDGWADPSRFGSLTNPYKYLTIFHCGHETDTSNKTRGMSWLGFSISDMLKRLYDRALGEWVSNCDRSTWEFYPAGLHSSMFQFNSADANGFYPYVNNRKQVFNAVDHKITNKFRLIKQEEDDDEIWLESSFAANWNTLPDEPVSFPIFHDPFEYAISNYKGAWEIATRFAESFGYGTRLHYNDEGVRTVTHIHRSANSALVSYPDTLEIKGVSFGEKTDRVICTPATDFGKVLHIRRTVTFQSYDNTTLNSTLLWDREKTSPMKEPHIDDTKVILIWDNEDMEYFNPSKSEVTETGTNPTGGHNAGDEIGSITQPVVYRGVANSVVRECVFGLLGNYPLLVFGGINSEGGVNMGYINKMVKEFNYVFAGTIAERVLLHRDNNYGYASSYPGLILFAGTSSDHGKTITPRTQPLNDGVDFYRGAAAIKVPFGDEDKFAFTAQSALALHELSIVYGSGEPITLVFPGLENFANERGETGYNAIYPDLCMIFDGGRFMIDRVRKISSSNTTEVDIRRLSTKLPLVFSETERPENLPNTSPSGDWEFNARLFWRGSGGNDNFESVANHH